MLEGLLGGLGDMDDPRRQALLAMAAGLLQPTRNKGGAGFAEALSKGIPAGLLGYNQASQSKRRNALTDMQAKMNQMQLDELERTRKFNQSAFSPGIGAQPLTPNDDNGNPMPGPDPTFNYSAASAIDPMKAWQMKQAMTKQAAPLVMKPGEAAFDPQGQRLFGNPVEEKPKYSPGDTRVVKSGRNELTLEMQPDRTWKTTYSSPMDKPEGEAKPQFVPEMAGYVYPPSAKAGPSFVPVQGAPASQKNAPSEAELTAAGYASRMNEANRLLASLPSGAVPGITQTVANNRYQTVAPFVASESQQQYRQAQEDWVRAKLRKESGAVIADEEMAREIRVYFPQPGDKPAVINQKAEARQRANDAMILASGKAASRIPKQSGGWSITRIP